MEDQKTGNNTSLFLPYPLLASDAAKSQQRKEAHAEFKDLLQPFTANVLLLSKPSLSGAALMERGKLFFWSLFFWTARGSAHVCRIGSDGSAAELR